MTETVRSFATLSLDLFLVLMEVSDLSVLDILRLRPVNRSWNVVLTDEGFMNAMRRRTEYAPVAAHQMTITDRRYLLGTEMCDHAADWVFHAAMALDWAQHHDDRAIETDKDGNFIRVMDVISNPCNTDHESVVRSMLSSWYPNERPWENSLQSRRNLCSDVFRPSQRASDDSIFSIDWEKLHVVTGDHNISKLLTDGIYITGSAVHAALKYGYCEQNYMSRLTIFSPNFSHEDLDGKRSLYLSPDRGYRVKRVAKTCLWALLSELPIHAMCICIGLRVRTVAPDGAMSVHYESLVDGPALFLSHRCKVALAFGSVNHYLHPQLGNFSIPDDDRLKFIENHRCRVFSSNRNCDEIKMTDAGIPSSVVDIYRQGSAPFGIKQSRMLSLQEIIRTCFYPCDDIAGMKRCRGEQQGDHS